MMAYAARWDARRCPRDSVREPFFLALTALVAEWMTTPLTHHLPEARTPAIQRATRYVRANSNQATPAGAAKAAGMSLRTLMRHFEGELKQSFREYRRAARMLDAMERLALADASVSATAVDVGFASIASFSSAFKKFTGETPTDFRTRIRSKPAG